MADTVIVCCPGNLVTGGPELLHQLVHELRTQGKDAFICYYPFCDQFNKPVAYAHYDTPQARIVDALGILLVFPETATHLIPKTVHSKIGIWWLSVDNFLGRVHSSTLKNVLEGIYLRIKGKRSLRQMRNYLHFAQSHYASEFLAANGMTSTLLTDYLGKSHMFEGIRSSEKLDQIAFNPKKGIEKTQKLIARNPDLLFVPIQGMIAGQVRDLLDQSKIYIDFGMHPGKDRFPREAAMAGCCLVTGTRGSAANNVDIPIPYKYKLNDSSDQFLQEFRPLVDDIFLNFADSTNELNFYRDLIRQEPDVFREQVKGVFMDFRDTQRS